MDPNAALLATLKREDAAEDAGRIEPDARLTCHTHQTWADRYHMERLHSDAALIGGMFR